MLITSRFVLLNVPKTGSSFVRAVLKAIYRRRRWRWGADRFLRELMLPKLHGLDGVADQHGIAAQIPERYSHLPVVAAVRNPYARLLSIYEFRWWADHPPLPREELAKVAPDFPDLSLDQFLAVTDVDVTRRLGGSNPLRIGRQTHDFIRFFFRNPDLASAVLSEAFFESGAFRDRMADVTLLRHESLREDLARFLVRFDFSADELDICRIHPRVNPTTPGAAERRALWTREALAHVATRERYLLSMLSQLGIDYAPPASFVAPGP